MEKGNAVKNLIKKNQLMITALAIMIAIAGYLQFAGTNLEKEYLTSDNTEDLSAVDSTDIVTDIESLDSDVEIVMEDYLDEDMQVAEATPDEGEIPGEAVLTGTNAVEVLSAARLSKEQTRARNKETLLEIINSTELSDAQKQEAVDSMVHMTEIAEKKPRRRYCCRRRDLVKRWSASTGMLWMSWSMQRNCPMYSGHRSKTL